MAALGPERHAEPELARALAHVEGEHAQHADRGDEERQQREGAEERRVEPRGRQVVGAERLERRELVGAEEPPFLRLLGAPEPPLLQQQRLADQEMPFQQAQLLARDLAVPGVAVTQADLDEAGALKWLESNFPDYKKVVADELEKLKDEIKQAAPQIVAETQQ